MPDQLSPHQHSPPLLCSSPMPAQPLHPTLSSGPSPVQDGTRRVRAELSGSAAGGAWLHPRDFPLVPRVCQFSACRAWGQCPRGTAQLVIRVRGAGCGPYPRPSAPFHAAPNPTDLTRESHGIFSLTFLSSWRRVNNRPEGRPAGGSPGSHHLLLRQPSGHPAPGRQRDPPAPAKPPQSLAAPLPHRGKG